MKAKLFLISPVRNIDEDYKNIVGRLVKSLERNYIVHWPFRDTKQDASALKICKQNRKAMAEADLVLIIWDGKSTGCVFDLGMAFAMGKQVIPVTKCFPERTEYKSLQNIVYELLEF